MRFEPSLPEDPRARRGVEGDDLGPGRARRAELGAFRVRDAARRRQAGEGHTEHDRLDHRPHASARGLALVLGVRRRPRAGAATASQSNLAANARCGSGSAPQLAGTTGPVDLLDARGVLGAVPRPEPNGVAVRADELEVCETFEGGLLADESLGGLHRRLEARPSAIVREVDSPRERLRDEERGSVSSHASELDPGGEYQTFAAKRCPPWCDEIQTPSPSSRSASAVYTAAPLRAQHRSRLPCPHTSTSGASVGSPRSRDRARRCRRGPAARSAGPSKSAPPPRRRTRGPVRRRRGRAAARTGAAIPACSRATPTPPRLPARPGRRRHQTSRGHFPGTSSRSQELAVTR